MTPFAIDEAAKLCDLRALVQRRIAFICESKWVQGGSDDTRGRGEEDKAWRTGYMKL